MANKLTENVEKFVRFYRTKEQDERREIRDKFLAASGLVYTSFYHKLSIKKFSLLELRALCEICGEDFLED